MKITAQEQKHFISLISECMLDLSILTNELDSSIGAESIGNIIQHFSTFLKYCSKAEIEEDQKERFF